MRRFAVLLLAPALLAATATPADATMPGMNGRIAINRAGDIYTVNSSGGDLRRLTVGGGSSSPKWSPDGKQIAFVRRGYIWTMDANGNNERQLWLGNSPAWSPDGSVIAFIVDERVCLDRNGRGWSEQAIVVRDMQGSDERVVTSAGVCYDDEPVISTHYVKGLSWSSSGGQLVTGHSASYSGSGGEYTAYYAGPMLVNVYSGARSPAWTENGVVPDVDFAPGGRTYAATQKDGRILSGNRSVTSDRNIAWPAYSPDGRQMLYTQRTPDGAYRTRKVTLGATVPPVTLTKGSQADWQPVR